MLDVKKDLVGDDGSLGGVGSLSGDREEGDDKGGQEGEEGFEGEGLHRDRQRRDTCLQVDPLVERGESILGYERLAFDCPTAILSDVEAALRSTVSLGTNAN